MRVIVCGGRTYSAMPDFVPLEHVAEERARVDRELRQLAETLDSLGITELAEGGAKGADLSALAWAELRGVPVQQFRAQWAAEGKAAGPRRNTRMLTAFKPDAVVAFPGGRGTADMVAKAKAAGVRVIEVAA